MKSSSGAMQSPLETTEVFESFIEKALRQSPAIASIEFATFSGSADDVISTGGQVYLRLRASQRLDNDGNSYEITARLAAVSGLWNVPNQPSEFLVLTPRDTDNAPGAAWAIWMGTAPGKLDQDKAFLSANAKLAISAVGLLLKTVGLTLNVDEGKFCLAWPNGTRMEGDSGSLRFVVCDSAGVASAFVIDAAGIKASLAPLGVPSLTWFLDGTSGSELVMGRGLYSAKFPAGFLGVGATPATGIGYGVGSFSLQSTTWYIQP